MGMFDGFGGGSSRRQEDYGYRLRQWLEDNETNQKIDEMNAMKSAYGPLIDEQLASTTDPERKASLMFMRAGLQAGGPDNVDDVMAMVKQQQHGNVIGSTPTDDMREFQMAQRQGYGGTLRDWIMMQHPAAAPPAVLQVAKTRADLSGRPMTEEDIAWASKQDPNTAFQMESAKQAAQTNAAGDQARNTAQGKEQGEQLGKDEANIRTALQKEEEKLARYQQIHGLLGESGGFAGKPLQELKKAAEFLGVNIEGVDEAAAASALENQLTLDSRSTAEGGGMPGSMSDADRNFLAAMQPGLSMTPGGRQKLIEIQKRLVERRREISNLASEYRKQHGGLDMGFYDELGKLREKSLFTGLVDSKPAEAQQPTWRVVR